MTLVFFKGTWKCSVHVTVSGKPAVSSSKKCDIGM